ncbi:hypothetical protein K466DRAFT_80854 [Polyporus arcularius HHB13444]|uniref:Uncharacterized protein n=1 Tax=Polyporus arcularius HHB13444 TaxID=1314778 RepID=A0A5C3PVW8_9APHY|nr:hypothetical protein K466DRAFT_80854 [Polyporus arcularius HHB13444]
MSIVTVMANMPRLFRLRDCSTWIPMAVIVMIGALAVYTRHTRDSVCIDHNEQHRSYTGPRRFRRLTCIAVSRLRLASDSQRGICTIQLYGSTCTQRPSHDQDALHLDNTPECPLTRNWSHSVGYRNSQDGKPHDLCSADGKAQQSDSATLTGARSSFRNFEA